MASIDYWAESPLNRHQMALFAPTLDATISPDDPVRLFDEVLEGLDWSAWEAEYNGTRGQPPIHPRYVAAAILYGLCRGIRSTRKLQEACCYRLDFLWLVEGRQIDHTTFAKFRTRFGEQLKGLFRQVCKIAMTLGLVRLGEVAFDATRVKAYNSRFNTRTAATLEEKLAALNVLFEQMLAEWDASEAQRQQDAVNDSPTQLPGALAQLDERRKRIAQALETARASDEARRKDGLKTPAQVPMADPESRVMPNKEGGYAPNYTPLATTDGECGFIVDCDVIAQVNETSEAVPSVDRIEENLGQKPKRFLTDAGNISGAVQQAMEARGIEFYAPVESHRPQPGNPALREDPTQPVPASEWPNLPRNSQGQLDKSCFVFDAANDQYYCPQGQTLSFEQNKREEDRERRVYRCETCAGCPLTAQCMSQQNQRGRSISHDDYEEVRDRTAARMATPEAKALYNQRPRIAETTFGILKNVFGLRQFLLRGQEKVRIEWRWATTAFNLNKLTRQMARLRAEFAQQAATTEV